MTADRFTLVYPMFAMVLLTATVLSPCSGAACVP